MLPYSHSPKRVLHSQPSQSIHSFNDETDTNLDSRTIRAFGAEWRKFHGFNDIDLTSIGNDYFDLVNINQLRDCIVLDVGCGSGRWAKYLSPHVKYLEAIDPSDAVLTASQYLQDCPNVRVTQASVDHIPFSDNSFDFIYSLGVFHHVPDTARAIKICFEKLKGNGCILLYLYYNFENRGFLFKTAFFISDLLRKVISKLPRRLKYVVCNMIAVVIYWPLSNLGLLISLFSESYASRLPLSYYRKTTFHIMRNDSLDRFGTPLEKRFSKDAIKEMLSVAGFHDILFSDYEPYWHVIARKP